jgi:micrococcal nuclease
MSKKVPGLNSVNLLPVILFVLIACFYFFNEKYPVFGQQRNDGFVTVSKVHDGDTVSVIMDNRREKVRLIGIDAPEMGQRPWGDEAKKYLENILSSSGWRTRLEFDVERRDKYGRLLAYLWTPDGRLVNLMMVRSGYAMLFTFPPNVKHANEFRAAQQEASSRAVGMWGDKGLKERPKDYRKAHPRI